MSGIRYFNVHRTYFNGHRTWEDWCSIGLGVLILYPYAVYGVMLGLLVMLFNR